MKVIVEIKEVHCSTVVLYVASNATREEITQAAQDKAGDASSLALEYSHTLDQENWNVRDDQGRYFGERGFGISP